jgi:hypothetical protein
MAEHERLEFDTTKPDGEYACGLCGSTNTQVISWTFQFCTDCRRYSTPRDRANWLQNHLDLDNASLREAGLGEFIPDPPN